MNKSSIIKKVLIVTAFIVVGVAVTAPKAEASTRHTTYRPSTDLAHVNPLSWNPPVNPLSWTPFSTNHYQTIPPVTYQPQPINYTYIYAGYPAPYPGNTNGYNIPVNTGNGYNNPVNPYSGQNSYGQPTVPSNPVYQNQGQNPVTPNQPIYTDPNTQNYNPNPVYDSGNNGQTTNNPNPVYTDPGTTTGSGNGSTF